MIRNRQAIFYALLGKFMVKVIGYALRQRYGPTMLPKPVIATGLLAVALGIGFALQRRDSGDA